MERTFTRQIVKHCLSQKREKIKQQKHTKYRKAERGNGMEDTQTSSAGRPDLRCIIRSHSMSRRTISRKGTTARLDFQKPRILKHKNIENLSLRKSP